MKIIADLHIHSRFSMATSKDLDFVALYKSALEKGIDLVGTGDFTHPGWMNEIEEQLVQAEDGLFKLRDDLESKAFLGIPFSCKRQVRFVLQVEISNIYKKNERVRKNHNLLYVPTIEAAKKISSCLEKIGNIKADGRPILGLNARDLLEITLESHPLSFLIPAHIWTPWFSVLGSKSGFDSIDECFEDLSRYVFAVETGLSSDPAMNWRLSNLDKYTLVSNSDAHSPAKLGREANLLDIDLGFEPLLKALRDKKGYLGTLEFYPDEGKYHLDGHRKCNIRLSPEETKKTQGICPVCGHPVTVGVLSRVEELADRTEGKPSCAFEYSSIVPLAEIVAQTLEVSPSTKKVANMLRHLRAELGPELFILRDIPLEEIASKGNDALSEAIRRVREGELIIDGGYDGEFGTVKIFEKGELSKISGQTSICGFIPPVFPEKKTIKERKKKNSSKVDVIPVEDLFPQNDAVETREKQKTFKAILDNPLLGLDEDQQLVVKQKKGPLLVVAGPGTGKTRTLVSRVLYQIKYTGIKPQNILIISFTNQAVQELEERIKAGLSYDDQFPRVETFHSFGKNLIKEFSNFSNYKIIEDSDRELLIKELLPDNSKNKDLKKVLSLISLAKQQPNPGLCFKEEKTKQIFDAYQKKLREYNYLDVDDLVLEAYEMLCQDKEMAEFVANRFKSIYVDEYQDVNDVQAALLKLLCPDGKKLMVIGDPQQAIYGFRGAKPGHFFSFAKTFSGRTFNLKNSYRLTDKILRVAKSVLKSEFELLSRKTGVKVELVSCPTAASEAQQIVVRIEELIGGSSFFALDSGRGQGNFSNEIGFEDVAILVRTKFQRGEILKALSQSGIPALVVGEDEPHDKRSQKVAVMTMHASKGREFEVVFVAGVEPRLVPLELPGKETNEEEERRLLYVAITRAKTLCVLSYAAKRTLFGHCESAGPSEFLSSIPHNAILECKPKLAPVKKKIDQMSLF